LFASRPFVADEVIGQYTGKVLYVKEGVEVAEDDRLVEIKAGIPGVVEEYGHVVAPSSFGYIQGSKRCFTTYAQDGGKEPGTVNAFLQDYMEHGICKVQLVALKAINAKSEIFLNYGDKYYSCDVNQGGAPGSRDLRLIPAWAAYSLFKKSVPEVVKAWGKIRRAPQTA